jgi:phosphoribosyl 1,2-cyclic phosphate phosphodiesterase
VNLRFLGTGTSFGIPVIGCRCAVCTSTDSRNKRTRHAVVLEAGDHRLLVDTPPELRLQLLAADLDRVDAVFLSHPHADHLHGIDDLRAFTGHDESRIPLHLAAEHVAEVSTRFSYFLGPEPSRQPGTVVPSVELTPFDDRDQVSAAGFDLRVIGFPHGAYQSYGFRCGDLSLLVDAKRVPDDVWSLLEGSRVLVLNALWFGSPHPAHFNVEQALEVIERVRPERALLTHLTHRLDHAELNERLPQGVEAAYDGMVVQI